jgi:hypothetical protein
MRIKHNLEIAILRGKSQHTNYPSSVTIIRIARQKQQGKN